MNRPNNICRYRWLIIESTPGLFVWYLEYTDAKWSKHTPGVTMITQIGLHGFLQTDLLALCYFHLGVVMKIVLLRFEISSLKKSTIFYRTKYYKWRIVEWRTIESHYCELLLKFIKLRTIIKLTIILKVRIGPWSPYLEPRHVIWNFIKTSVPNKETNYFKSQVSNYQLEVLN